MKHLRQFAVGARRVVIRYRKNADAALLHGSDQFGSRQASIAVTRVRMEIYQQLRRRARPAFDQ